MTAETFAKDWQGHVVTAKIYKQVVERAKAVVYPPDSPNPIIIYADSVPELQRIVALLDSAIEAEKSSDIWF